MFHSARIKLTAYYLIIIMLVSSAFSIIIYRFLTTEIDRIAYMQRVRIERRMQIGFFTQETIDPEIIIEAKKRIVLILLGINGTILVVSGGVGYFLAGLTLKPIQEMVDEQNRFISDASHELRTPLTSLKAAMEVYLRDKKPSVDETRLLISESIDEVNKLQSLSDSLLNLSSSKSNDRSHLRQVNFKKIINDAIRKINGIVLQKNIKIEVSGCDYKFMADPDSITQLFVILLENAIKYSDKNKKVLVKSQKTHDNILISITDFGIGIEKKDIDHIFDRFYRADTARSRETGGYGLGLSIAKKIVENHNGSIKVESTFMKGSTFTIAMPCNFS